jgi:hypothetical protein
LKEAPHVFNNPELRSSLEEKRGPPIKLKDMDIPAPMQRATLPFLKAAGHKGGFEFPTSSAYRHSPGHNALTHFSKNFALQTKD